MAVIISPTGTTLTRSPTNVIYKFLMVVQFWQSLDPSVISIVEKGVIVMCMSLTLILRVISYWTSTYKILPRSIAISDSDRRDPSLIVFDPPTANNGEKAVCFSISILVA